MIKLIFTLYMLFLFIFAAEAYPNQTQRSAEKTMVIVQNVDQVAVVQKRAQIRLQRRVHRKRIIKAERRHIRAHRRHALHCDH